MPQPRVIDEFSYLAVSHQRKTQLRYKRDGKCQTCGEPRVTKTHCLKHALAVRRRARKNTGVTRHNKSLTDYITLGIVDEFTHLPIYEFEKTQLRHLRDGKCRFCDDPLVTKRCCLKHAKAQREYARKRNGCKRRNKNARSYRAAQQLKEAA